MRTDQFGTHCANANLQHPAFLLILHRIFQIKYFNLRCYEHELFGFRPTNISAFLNTAKSNLTTYLPSYPAFILDPSAM